MSKQLRIKRLFSFAFGSLAMLAVALLSAFVTMRLAIHGREVEVPSLAGLTLQQAQERASSKGLNLLVENRFYSTVVPAGHILSQLPAPGETVRRDWQVRVAESLGGQHVSIPDVVGQSERSATISLRRLSLDLGTVAHIPAEGPADTIIAQTPPPNAENIDGPRVSLLVSEAADAQTPEAFVMPTLTGLSSYAAAARAAAAGLHIIATPDPVAATPDPAAGSLDAQTPPTAAAAAPPADPAALTSATGNVVSQYPLAGHHVVRGEGVHLSFAHAATPTAAPVVTAPPAQ